MSAINTTKARILTCKIGPQAIECRSLVRAVAIRESLCQSYLTGEFTLVDSFNIIADMELQNSDPIELSFDAPIKFTA